MQVTLLEPYLTDELDILFNECLERVKGGIEGAPEELDEPLTPVEPIGYEEGKAEFEKLKAGGGEIAEAARDPILIKDSHVGGQLEAGP